MENIFTKVAKLHNVTEDEVKGEIEHAIQLSMDSMTPETKKIWNVLFPDFSLPSPEDAVAYLSILSLINSSYAS